jgi:hypothetical protein
VRAAPRRVAPWARRGATRATRRGRRGEGRARVAADRREQRSREHTRS